MEFETIVNFIINLWPMAEYIFIGLGALVVVGTTIETIVPDKYDKGFMKKIMSVPVLGEFLNFISKFSPFNSKH